MTIPGDSQQTVDKAESLVNTYRSIDISPLSTHFACVDNSQTLDT